MSAQKEKLEFLAATIQARVSTEISSPESISVRCAVNKDQLMILLQHPSDVMLDTQKTSSLISTILDSSTWNHHQQGQIFIRVVAQKLPYFQSIWNAGSTSSHGYGGARKTTSTSVLELENPAAVTITATTVNKNRFDFFTKSEKASSLYNEIPLKQSPLEKSSPTKINQIPILTIAALLVMLGFGGGAYWLTRSCVLGAACQQLDSAKLLDASFPGMVKVAQSPQDLELLTRRLEDVNQQLTSIPQLSPHYQEASDIGAKLTGKLQQINQVIKGLKAGEIAIEQSRFLTTNMQELQNRQQLWRQAIAPLENINPSGEFYNLSQSRILQYRSGLQAINVQLLSQEKWNSKLTAAKNVAQAAAQRESTAKNLVDLQKVQETWQIVVNALVPIPQTSPVYQEAQQLLRLYQPRLIMARDRATKEELAARAYIKAVETAKLAESSQQQNQWQVATTQWQQAVNALQVIPITSSYHNQAQELISPYKTALQQAQLQQQTVVSNLTQTRSDLEKTCRGKVRICTFTVDDKIVNVRITRDYEQVLQSNFANMNNSNIDSVKNHLETLQQAIEVISDNAKMPILVFDAQGQQIHTHLPQANTNLTSN